MAIILPTSTDDPQFSFETQTFGPLNALHMTVGRMKEINHESTTQQFIDQLIKAIVRKPDGEALTAEDIGLISLDERESFSNAYIEHHPYLFKERISRTRDEDGKRIISFQDGEVEHAKKDDESSQEYLHRLTHLQSERLAESVRKTIEPIQKLGSLYKDTFSVPFLDSLAAARTSSMKLENTLKEITRSEREILSTLNDNRLAGINREIPTIENPVHETNRLLETVSRCLGNLESLGTGVAETVKDVSNAASQFLIDFKIATKAADKTSKRALLLAVLAILGTAVQIGYSEWRAQRDDASTAAAISEISKQMSDLITAQKEGTQTLSTALSTASQQDMKAINELTAALNNLVTTLNSQQKEPLKETDQSGTAH